MEWIALLLALIAIVLFLVHALRTRPYHYGWIGMACVTVSLIVWHVVAGLEPIINRP